ncbi:MAG: hypothetical protein LBJ57_03255 [Prevotellaceae bacterium]|nr:hypothetical protein [Prevotellaceae bacterium]
MKNNSFTTMAFVSLLAVAAVCSCDKDKDKDNNNNSKSGFIQNNAIEINLENGGRYSEKVDTVKLTIYSEELHRSVALVSVPYGNGKFTLKLPTSVDAKYLKDFHFEYADEARKGLTISDSKVQESNVSLLAYKAGSEVGALRYGVEDWDKAENWDRDVYLTYVDRDVSITGSYTGIDSGKEVKGAKYSYSYSVNMKKGWNLRYEEGKVKAENLYEITITTQIPAEAKWYLYLRN